MQIAVPYLQRPGPAVLYPLPIYLLLMSVLFESQFSSFCLLMFSLWHCPPSPVSAADKILPPPLFPCLHSFILCYATLVCYRPPPAVPSSGLWTDIILLSLNNYLFLGRYPAAAPQVTAESSETQYTAVLHFNGIKELQHPLSFISHTSVDLMTKGVSVVVAYSVWLPSPINATWCGVQTGRKPQL